MSHPFKPYEPDQILLLPLEPARLALRGRVPPRLLLKSPSSLSGRFCWHRRSSPRICGVHRSRGGRMAGKRPIGTSFAGLRATEARAFQSRWSTEMANVFVDDRIATQAILRRLAVKIGGARSGFEPILTAIWVIPVIARVMPHILACKRVSPSTREWLQGTGDRLVWSAGVEAMSGLAKRVRRG